MSIKKVLMIVLAFVMCSGAYRISQAQEAYTIAGVHPFTGRFAFAGIRRAGRHEGCRGYGQCGRGHQR